MSARRDPAQRLAAYLARTLNYDEERQKVMAYGLGALFQMLLLLACSLAFGIIARCAWEAMILFWGVGFLRRSTGGVHCDTYLGCVCVSLTSICGLAALCRYAVPAALPLWAGIVLGILPAYAFLIVIAWKKAPRESANKPIRNPEKIARLRKQCFCTIALYFIASSVCLALSARHPRMTGLFAATVAAAWWSGLMMTDAAAGILHRINGAPCAH